VKHALRRATGENFAVKILDRGRVLSLRGADDQVRREIATLTMLRHPNVVRLHEVTNSIHSCLLGLACSISPRSITGFVGY
jgi:5'-AMP-activated protein kinase catalytic alpha subunit